LGRQRADGLRVQNESPRGARRSALWAVADFRRQIAWIVGHNAFAPAGEPGGVAVKFRPPMSGTEARASFLLIDLRIHLVIDLRIDGPRIHLQVDRAPAVVVAGAAVVAEPAAAADPGRMRRVREKAPRRPMPSMKPVSLREVWTFS